MRPLGTCVMVALVLLLHGPLNAEAQPRTPHVALLSIGTDPARPLPPQWVAFFDALRALGYVDGRNIVIERRFAGGNEERVTEFAEELARRKVDVIVVTGAREVHAARRATDTIPVVTIVAPDLVAAGLVSSLAQPGGNITGLTFSASGVGGKYVELLREAVPSATRVDILASRPQTAGVQREMLEAARTLKLSLSAATLVQQPEDFEPFFARAKREGTAGLIVPIDGLTHLHRQKVVDLAAKYRLPTIYALREHVEVGGLMAYGASFPDLFRRSATFVDKILKGARPAELPVEQPTKFELVINLKTARALGLTIPQTLLARVDDLIQ